MKTFESSWYSLRTLDELAFQKSVIHTLPSIIKLLTTVAFLVTVVSFSRYEVVGLITLLIYPILMISLADLPSGFLVKQMLLVAPLVAFVAIFNPLFDHSIGWKIGEVTISGGWLSFISIILKFILTVLSCLVLIATSGIEGVCSALTRLKFPRILAVQLLLIYRYIMVLMDEAGRLTRAYHLRSVTGKGIEYRAWGSLLGQFLLRSIDRAGRIYQAMRCRGFDGEFHMLRNECLTPVGLCFMAGWVCFFIMVRFYNLPYLFGKILMGVNG